MNTLQVLAQGMQGEPIPYLLRADWTVTGVLFICVILLAFIVSRSKKHLLRGLKDFVRNRKRGSLFDETAADAPRHNVVLLFHTCVMLGLCVYQYVIQSAPVVFEPAFRLLVLSGFIFFACIYYLIKWIVYASVNYVFFQKDSNIRWMVSFFNVHIWLGMLLLPLLIAITQLDILSQNATLTLCILFVFAKTVLFWKCFSNFFEKIHGFFHLILYFCALEILPDLMLWKGIEIISNNLIKL